MNQKRWIPAALALAIAVSAAGCSSTAGNSRQNANPMRTVSSTYRRAGDPGSYVGGGYRTGNIGTADSFYQAGEDGTVFYYSNTSHALKTATPIIRQIQREKAGKTSIYGDDRSGPATLANYSQTPIPTFPHSS